jgi:hypothetical protein
MNYKRKSKQSNLLTPSFLTAINKREYLFNSHTHKICCQRDGNDIIIRKSQNKCFYCEAERIKKQHGII